MKKTLSILLILISFCSNAQDKKISQLPALPSVSGNEQIPLAKSGLNYYTTPSQMASWLNIIGYVPLSGTTNSHPLTGTIEYRPGITYSTALVDTINDFFIGTANRKDIGSSTIQSSIYFGATSSPEVELFATDGSTTSYVDVSNSEAVMASQDATHRTTLSIDNVGELVLASNYTTFKGAYYTPSTCAIINSHSDSTSLIHKGFIQRLIAAATPSITLTGDVTSTGTGTLTTTVGKIKNITVPTPTTGVLTYTSGAFQWLPAGTNLSFNSPLSNTSNTVSLVYGTGLSVSSGSLVTSAIPNASLLNSTISGAALGTNLSNLIAGYGISGSNYNGNGSQTWVSDTTSSNGLVSKLRLTAQLVAKQAALSGTGYLVFSGTTPSYTTSIPNGSLTNSTISGIALGANLSNLTTGYGLSGSSYNGSGAIAWTTDTTVVVSKLYFTAKVSAYITNAVTTLSSLSSVGTVTTGIWAARIQPRVVTVTTSSLITINTDITDVYTVTSLSTATTFTIPSGTPTAGQKLIVRIKDNATARALTFSTGTNGFRFSSDFPAPTTTTLSKTMYIGWVWNEADSKWDNYSPYIDNF